MLLIADNGEAYHPENAEKMLSFKAENCLKRGFLRLSGRLVGAMHKSLKV